MQTRTLIIGGGLAGLGLAERLARQDDDFLLVEARSRLGGRVLTERAGDGDFDLGPAWFWAGQPRIAALIDHLKLQPFEQYHTGALSFEDAEGKVDRGQSFGAMQDSYRLRGGAAALTDALAARLPTARVLRSTQVVGLAHQNGGIAATTQAGQTIRARQVVLAVPPRIASAIAFHPALPETAHDAMEAIPTWMAGQAKAVAIYDRPFWRRAGLSGHAISRRGPMVEIHDASPAAGAPYALFGFIGIPPAARRDQQRLRHALQQQLIRLFGPDAASPRALLIKDWAFDHFTSTALDQQPLLAHPEYGLPDALDNLLGGRLIFGGTEVAAQFGGYLEGALEAAEHAFDQLIERRLEPV